MSISQPAPATEPDRATQLDPDRPWWGIPVGLLVWLASMAALFVGANLGAVVAVIVEVARTGNPPSDVSLTNPAIALPVVISQVPAHLITLGITWAVVTRLGQRPFLASFGWNWAGMSGLLRTALVIGVVVASYALGPLLTEVMPQHEETEFEKLLRASQSVRIAVAFMAVVTAPMVEEVVYRGVLFSALRRRLAQWPSIIVVTVLFAAIHFPQYWGAWATVTQLTILSLVLTLIRAKTRSLLPCFAIHTVFNVIGAIFIIVG